MKEVRYIFVTLAVLATIIVMYSIYEILTATDSLDKWFVISIIMSAVAGICVVVAPTNNNDNV